MDSWNSDRVTEVMRSLRAADVGRVRDLLIHWWPELSYDGHFETVLEALAMLDQESLRGIPELGLLAEIMGYLPAGSVPDPVIHDEERLKTIGFGDEAKVWLQANLLACLRARRLGEMAHARRLVARGQVVAAAARWAPRSSASDLLPLWFATAGATLLVAGDLAAVSPLLRMGHLLREREAYQSVGDAYVHVSDEITESLTLLHGLRGDLRQADVSLERHSRANEWVTTLGGPGVEIIAADRLEARPAQRPVVPPVPMLSVSADGWALELFSRVHTALTWGDVAGASQDIQVTADRESRRLARNSFARGILRMLEVDVSLANGDGDRARSLLGHDVPRWLAGRAARLDLLTGELELAGEKATASMWAATSGPRDRTEMLLLRAVARLRSGDDNGARDDAEMAATSARPHGQLRAFATVPRGDLETLAQQVAPLEPIVDVLRERGVPSIYPDRAEIVRLTGRERTVLEQLSTGTSLVDVAADLYVSVNTVKTQLRSAYRKLGVNNRQDAVARAIDDLLITVPPTKDRS